MLQKCKPAVKAAHLVGGSLVVMSGRLCTIDVRNLGIQKTGKEYYCEKTIYLDFVCEKWDSTLSA